MDVLVGLGLLIWSCGLFVFKQFFSDGLTSQSIVQIAVAGIGSLVILGPKAFSFLMNFELPDKDDDDLDEIELDDEHDYNDFKALNYLKDRSLQIGSQEAFDLVVKLNTLIFSGDYKEEEFYEE
jgi:hypothetical protein|tara:strand:+ start:177 stop:548 length:372 start_codon:yes stop_codon:yes gene_type:complete